MILRYLFIAIVILFFDFQSTAQINGRNNYNFKEYEQKPFYFGIQMGVTSSGYKITQSQEFYQKDSFHIIESPLKGGFTISFIGNLKIGKYFDFRTTPGFAFTERNFDFFDESEFLSSKKNETYTFDIPLILRFKSAPYHDKRLFILAGVKYEYNFSNNNGAREELSNGILTVSPHDFQYVIGAGVQFFLPYVIFSPQLTFAQSVSNIHVRKNKLQESSIIDQLLSRIFSLTINLEG